MSDCPCENSIGSSEELTIIDVLDFEVSIRISSVGSSGSNGSTRTGVDSLRSARLESDSLNNNGSSNSSGSSSNGTKSTPSPGDENDGSCNSSGSSSCVLPAAEAGGGPQLLGKEECVMSPLEDRGHKLPPMSVTPNSNNTMLDPNSQSSGGGGSGSSAQGGDPLVRSSATTPDLNSSNSKRIRSRSRSPARFQGAHNRFHYNCCDKKAALSVEDVKAKSIENAYRRRKSRNNLIPSVVGGSNSGGVGGGGNNNSGNQDNSGSPMTVDKSVIVSFLQEHPDFLEHYVLHNVDRATLERWTCHLPKKGKRNAGASRSNRVSTNSMTNSNSLSSLSRNTALHHQSTSAAAASGQQLQVGQSTLLHKLSQSLKEKGSRLIDSSIVKEGHGKAESRDEILYEIAAVIAKDLNATGFHFYIVEDEQSIVRYEPGNSSSFQSQHIGSGTTMASHCAKTGSVLRDSTANADPRYPEGVQGVKKNQYVMIHPIVTSLHHCVVGSEDDEGGRLLGIIELLRSADSSHEPFSDIELETLHNYLIWADMALNYCELCFNVGRQKDLKNFLLNVVKSIFMEMISMDTLIVKIMNFAQKLVDADRASLFLVDSKTNQLYARIFDIQSSTMSTDEFGEITGAIEEAAAEEEDEEDVEDDASTLDGDEDEEERRERKMEAKLKKKIRRQKEKKTEKENQGFAREIRFPVGVGIAGYVAETAETLNVADAYTDPRFNKSIDEQTGYVTKNILCMPICIRGQVIGVVQMVNKTSGAFTKDDEEAFETFSVYCGLALHHAKLYDKIRRSEQKYKVALEVLSYHNSSSVNEVEDIIHEPVIVDDPEISNFTFYALNMGDTEKIKKALFMFVDLFGLERFEYETIVRFLITVKKNYRQVAYHNWTHGFHVANSIYSILKSTPGIFKPLECLAMYIGAICHDLDHRGFNNKFMIDVGSPLAAIYSTSTMEHHHFNMTVNILQQENHNIFSKLNPDEYRQVLGNIKHCILATDLALFFPNKARLTNILKENAFSWDLPDHRLLVETLMMTASDLCSSSKPWDLQLATVNTIYEEFYKQGDIEIKHGRKPVPIMNRAKFDQQAIHQGDVEKTLGWTPIPLFDRDHQAEVASMQVGFIGGICLPCYDLLVQVLPSTAPMQEQCAHNLQTWKGRAEKPKKKKEEEEEEETEEVEQIENGKEEEEAEEEAGSHKEEEEDKAEGGEEQEEGQGKDEDEMETKDSEVGDEDAKEEEEEGEAAAADEESKGTQEDA